MLMTQPCGAPVMMVDDVTVPILTAYGQPILVRKLGTQWSDSSQDGVENELFKTFCNNGGACNCTVVIWLSCCRASSLVNGGCDDGSGGGH